MSWFSKEFSNTKSLKDFLDENPIIDDLIRLDNTIVYLDVKHKVEFLPGKEVKVKFLDTDKIPLKIRKDYWVVATDRYSYIPKIGYTKITKVEYDWLINQINTY